MKFARIFTLGVLLAPAMIWPAAAHSEPAVSLQHLLLDNDCEAVPEILGDWTTHGDLSGTWTIQALQPNKYRLIEKVGESDNPNKMAFDVCAAHLGGYLFFDATLQEVAPNGRSVLTDDEKAFWVPLHLIGRLEIKEDSLKFLLLDDGWLQEELKSGRLDLSHSESDEGQYLITAPSKELKQFAASLADDPTAFSYAEGFERVSPEQAARRPAFIFETRGSERLSSVATRSHRTICKQRERI